MFNRNNKTKYVSKLAVVTLALVATCNTAMAQEDDADAEVKAMIAAQLAQEKAAEQPKAAPKAIAISAEAAEIAAINERVAVMAARLAELEIQAKISAKEKEINQNTAGLEGLNQLQDSAVPSVSEISGVDGKIWAVLNVPGGKQTVRVGDTAFGWRVTGIQKDTVSVHKNGSTLRLAFGKMAVNLDGSNPRAIPGMQGVGNGIYSGQ